MRTTNEWAVHAAWLFAVTLSAPSIRAQATTVPAMEMLTRVDGGVGGMLRLTDGTRCEFHIEVTGTRARLCDKYAPDSDASGFAFGSAEERKHLALLDAWVDATFPAEARAEVLAPEQLPSPSTNEQDMWHRRASLLRTLHAYHRATRPAIDKVFVGRGTVSLSMQLRLGDDPPRQILWRNLGDQPFARMHCGTEEKPVALDSRDEREILLGMRYWLAARLGKDDVWEADAKKANDEVRRVLDAVRGYLTATSPRLRTAGTVMDAGTNGSKFLQISDARNHVICVKFDHSTNTPTPGRMREGGDRDAPIVELGSARERELLTMLQSAATLRRAFLREKQDDDWQLRLLEDELTAYEKQFPAKE